jgi:uncharacterized protein YggE
MQTIMKAACLLSVLTVAVTTSKADKPPRTISVSGEGKVFAAPDLATIQTGVVTQGETAQDALRQNNEAMKKLMQVLKQHHVADKDVQTTSFNVSPIYKRDERGRMLQEITGYRVQNQLRVQVRKLADLGEVLDALVKAGSNQVSGISFGVGDATGILNQARSKAIRDARSRAEVYAQAGGVSVGAIRQISEQPPAIPRPMQMGFARAEAAGVPIATGEQEFRVTVHLVFALEDADGR